MATNPQSNLDVIVRGVDELSPQMKTMESRVIRFVGAVGASLAALRIVAFPVIAAAQFEREMANVTKTTNFSTREIKRLGDELRAMSLQTSTSAVDLAKIAAAGGQLGLGREGVDGIRAFTDSVQRMSVVLDLVPEEAATQFGKIKNIFNANLSDMERVVSSFNQTSNNTTASGKDLLDVVRRLGNASGTVNLQQSIGLSASALDFGVSPEVAGTALSKMFSSLLQKADKFSAQINGTYDNMGKRISMTTKGWVDIVSKDGVAGFKMALDSLRKLDASAQQTAIVKLFGGGRIGSLASKYVQDVNNSVIDRDIFQASEGYANGLSALREQATVLNTLTEQSKILYNSIEKDAIEAGDQLSGDLINHVRDLTKSLQNPGVQSFLNQVIASVGDLVNLLAGAVSRIAGWNINWDNFIRLAKKLVELKVASAFISMLSSVSGLDARMARLALSAGGAAAATEKVGAATAKAGAQSVTSGTAEVALTEKSISLRQRMVAGWHEMTAIQERSNALLREQESLTVALVTAREKANTAQAAESTGFARVDRQSTVVNKRSDNTAQAAATFETAARAQMNTELSLRNEMDTRLLARTAKHEAEVAAIEAEGAAKRAAARALGRNKEGEAEYQVAKAWQANMLKSELETYQNSLTGIKRYWTQRLETEMASRNVAMDALKVDLVARETAEEASRARLLAMQTKFGVTQGAVATTGEAVKDIEDKAAATGASLEAAALRGGRSWQGLTLILGTAKVALQWLLSAAMKFFFWGTILFSIADMLGLVEKLPAALQKLTDWMGFTSKATRDLAIAKEQEAKAHEKVIARLDESIDRYKKLQGEQGKYTKELAAVDAGRHKTADINTANTADANLLTVIQGAADQRKKNDDEIAKAVKRLNSGTLQKELKEAQEALAKAQEEAEKTSKTGAAREQRVSIKGATPVSAEARANIARQVADANEAAALQVTKATEAVKAQKDALDFAAKAARGEYLPALKDITEEQLAAAKAYVTRYTSDTADAFLAKTPAILAAFAAQKKARADFEKSQSDLTEARNAKDDKAILDAQDRGAKASALSTQAGIDLDKAQKELVEFANARAKTAATPAERVAWEELARQAAYTAEQITGAARAINAVRDTGTEDADAMLGKVGLSLDALATMFGTTREKVLQHIRDLITEASPLLAQLSPTIQKVIKDVSATVNGLFDGSTARSADTPTTGKEPGGTGGESEARKIAKAKIKLQNAEIEAQTAFLREGNQQELDADERKYNQGLRAMEDYYAERKRVQLQIKDDDIAARQREIAEVVDAWKHATTESEKLQYEAQKVKLEGEVKLLGAQKLAVMAENDEALRAAKEQFTDQINANTVEMFNSLTLDGTVSERWKASLDNEYARYRLFLRQIESETLRAQKDGDTARVEQLKSQSEAVTRAYVAAAFSSALDGLNAKADVSYNAVEQYQRRLEALRGTGAITAQEAEIGLNQAIAAQIPLLQQQLTEGEALLQQQQKGTLLYNQQAQAVEEMRLRLMELGLQANKTARDINAGIGESLKKALSELEPTMKSLKDVVLGFLKDVTSQLQKRFTDNIADQIMGKVDGADGAGGLGGWIAALLGQKVQAPAAGAGTQPKGDVTSPIYAYTMPAPNSPLAPGTVGAPVAPGAQQGGLTAGTLGLLTGAAQGAMGGGMTGGILGGILGGMNGFGAAPAGGGVLGSSETNPLYVTVVGGNAMGPGTSGGSGGLMGGLMGMAGNLLGGMAGGSNGLVGGATLGTGFGQQAAQFGGSRDSSADSAKAIQSLGGIFTDTSAQSTQAITNTQMSTGADGVVATGEVASTVATGTTSVIGTLASGFMSMIMAVRTSGGSGGAGGSMSGMGMGIAGMLGTWAGTKLAGAHTGGVIGSSNLRSFVGINPAIFASASRYHNGGVVGLGPDEVPIIAKKGEEMLTERDARHRDNGGLAGGGGAPVQMAQTLVFDTQAAAKAILTGANLVTAIKPNVKTLRQLLGVK